MANKKLKPLSPQLLGLVGRHVAKISFRDELPLDEALEKYCDKLTKTMKKYDLGSSTDEIIENAEEKLNRLNSISPKTKPIKQTRTVKAKPLPKTEAKPKKPIKKYVNPLMIKVKGEVNLKDTPEGVIIQRTKRTKKVSIQCPEGTHGTKITDDTAGCEFD